MYDPASVRFFEDDIEASTAKSTHTHIIPNQLN